MSDEQQPTRPVSRRRLLQASALAIPTAGVLAACARDSGGGSGGGGATGSASATTLQLASPTNPVKWPIAADNQPIASGLEPEQGATLQVYNYADYLNPEVVTAFEKKYEKYGVKVAVSTFNDYSEALAKIRTGTTPFDVYFPSYDAIGKLVTASLIRPLQHSYITNIGNVFPTFQNPWYDLEWQYTVPYVLYTTGIGWRNDKISEDVGARPNPYDIFWDPKYREKIAVLDDYREVIGMTLLRNGGTDVNTGDEAQLNAARDAMLLMNQTTKPKVTITDYTDIPEGRTDLSLAWSGDMIAAVQYLPEGTKADILRYWFPTDGKGLVNNDLIVALKGGNNPVLSHLFINFMLDTEVAKQNMTFVGYQPPQVALTPDALVAAGLIPENLKSAVVLPSYFDVGYRQLELSPELDAKYQAIWQQFKAGG